jgi:hypothetical protein
MRQIVRVGADSIFLVSNFAEQPGDARLTRNIRLSPKIDTAPSVL